MIKKNYIFIFFALILVFGILFAGSFNPDPSSPGGSNYTLSDIYNKISSSTYEYSAHTFSPLTAPSGTLHTITEIWDAIIWQTSDNSGTIQAGFYATSSLETAEPNLIASNIATGTTIFGVTGTCVAPDPDPCDGVEIGSACVGGALYAGEYNGSKYMTTPSNESSSQWSNEHIVTGATSLTDGSLNTAILLALPGTYYAADTCGSLDIYGYTDWFLPAKNELSNVLYPNRIALGGFGAFYYWSSTEMDNAFTYADFNGSNSGSNKINLSHSFRCVRKY